MSKFGHKVVPDKAPEPFSHTFALGYILLRASPIISMAHPYKNNVFVGIC